MQKNKSDKRDLEIATDVSASKNPNEKKKAVLAFILKLALMGAVFGVFIGGMYLLFRLTGLTKYMRDLDLMTQVIRDFGPKGAVVYLVLVIVATILLPIPGILIILAGVAIYGPWLTILLVSIGTIIGSTTAFMLGRIFGRGLINWLFGKDKAQKHIDKMTKNSRVPLFAMLILPFFPDDMLCMAAGVTDLKLAEFVIIVLLARLPIIALTAFFGSGNIIPFTGWGRIVWIVVGVVAALLAIIWFSYKITKWIKSRKKNVPKHS